MHSVQVWICPSQQTSFSLNLSFPVVSNVLEMQAATSTEVTMCQACSGRLGRTLDLYHLLQK